jgi:hypothetical protein
MQVETNQKASRTNGRNTNHSRGSADNERQQRRPSYQRPSGNSGNFAHSILSALDSFADDNDPGFDTTE